MCTCICICVCQIHVAEWYFKCVIVLSQIVGLCVLRCRVGMVGTNWLNLDIYRLSINLIMFVLLLQVQQEKSMSFMFSMLQKF